MPKNVHLTALRYKRTAAAAALASKEEPIRKFIYDFGPTKGSRHKCFTHKIIKNITKRHKANDI